ncbi:Neurogenic locus notch 2 [Liparis tanakae]|uniref:Neurogenic locus notch 2 n=1 Tax=Liparis tanakae TaxID=230148 RepID=A0A4Z2G4T1_9TELE|nr:Neurogenic locus notch 2 [Liparis tanakae]
MLPIPTGVSRDVVSSALTCRNNYGAPRLPPVTKEGKKSLGCSSANTNALTTPTPSFRRGCEVFFLNSFHGNTAGFFWRTGSGFVSCLDWLEIMKGRRDDDDKHEPAAVGLYRRVGYMCHMMTANGLDRVVLELLRAGVPVNNTDHTGRSALHWASSVNHLTLTRTLIRYGAAVDLQDNKGETALFLSALHGCYDTARLLLLHGGNLELRDRRGRRPSDAAREGAHHAALELLLAHQAPRGPLPTDAAGDALWEEHALAYSPWAGAQGTPGRSASFSGSIGHRDMTPPPQNDWSMGRVQYPCPQNWRPQLNQSATALVPPRVMGRSPRPISTLQEVTSEDEDRDRHQEVLRAATPHFLSPQPAPRQRSFSCTQHALQRRSNGHQPEPNYVIVTDRTANEPAAVVVSPPAHAERPPLTIGEHPGRAEHAAPTSEHKSRGQRSNYTPDSTQTAL